MAFKPHGGERTPFFDLTTSLLSPLDLSQQLFVCVCAMGPLEEVNTIECSPTLNGADAHPIRGHAVRLKLMAVNPTYGSLHGWAIATSSSSDDPSKIKPWEGLWKLVILSIRCLSWSNSHVILVHRSAKVGSYCTPGRKSPTQWLLWELAHP